MYLMNGEPNWENQERDRKWRALRPDLHSMSYDGEICWMFIPVETELNIYSLEELARLPDIDFSVIGFKRCEYPFIEAFWNYNERFLNTNRELAKCTVKKFMDMGLKYVYNPSLGRYFNWRQACDNWSVHSDPHHQYCLVPRIWIINEDLEKPNYPRSFAKEEHIVGKNLADDTVCEDLEATQFFN